MKKLSNIINEGLWSKGVNRSKTGELRKEETCFKRLYTEISKMISSFLKIKYDKDICIIKELETFSRNQMFFVIFNLSSYGLNDYSFRFRCITDNEIDNYESIKKSFLNTLDYHIEKIEDDFEDLSYLFKHLYVKLKNS